MCVWRGVLKAMLGIFFNCFPLCLLKQDLSLNFELNILAMVAGYKALGYSCLCTHSTAIADVHLHI